MRLTNPIALALILLLGLTSHASADTVYMRNGDVFKGRVTDAKEFIILEKKLGEMKIAKADIDHIVKDESVAPRESAAGDGKPDDVIIQDDGKSLRGRARYSPDGKEVWVKIRGNRVAIPRNNVRDILWGGKRKETETIKGEISKRVEKMVAGYVGAGKAQRRKLVAELKAVGVFAVPHVKALLEKSDKKAEFRAGLMEVLRFHRIKPLVDNVIEAKVKEVFDRLVSEDDEIRAACLKEIVLEAPESSPALLMYFLEYDLDPAIRALCVSQLSMLRRFEDLVNVLRMPDGSMRLAAAIALGEQGVMVGIPILIDGLALASEALRGLTSLKLREITGQDFAYSPIASEKDRAAAIGRWRAWWKRVGKA